MFGFEHWITGALWQMNRQPCYETVSESLLKSEGSQEFCLFPRDDMSSLIKIFHLMLNIDTTDKWLSSACLSLIGILISKIKLVLMTVAPDKLMVLNKSLTAEDLA